MKRFPVFGQSLSDLRWLIFWFGSGLSLYGGGMIWLFPFFRDYLERVTESYPEELLNFFGGGELADAAGFITLEYQSFAVLILIIYAVVASTGLLAGEEGRGTLDGLLAQPIARRRVILEKSAAFLAGAFAVCAIVSIGWLLSVPFVELKGELSLLELIAMTFGGVPVVLLFGALGLALGAVAPSRGTAAGVLTAIAIIGYLAAALAGVIEPIERARFLSPYYYSDATIWLTEGPIWWHQAALLVATALAFTLAVRAFQVREIGAGTWQLRRLVSSRQG